MLMNLRQSRNLVIALSLLSAVMFIAAASFWLKWTSVQINAVLAEDQMKFFDEMREHAESADSIEAVECLEAVVNYYPSGTKQTAGTPLDRCVERARNNVIREIVEQLRTQTGEDHGEKAQGWIEAMKKTENSEPTFSRTD